MASVQNIDIPAANAEQHTNPAADDRPRSVATPVSYRYHRSELFANETPFQEGDDSLGDHWSVPWSDLMMVMFVLFAALLAAKMNQPDIEIRDKTQPVPEIAEIEKDRVVKEELLSRQPSFEPLIPINVFDRSQDAIGETQLQNVEVALLDDKSVKVSVQGPMFFERAKANLRPEVTEFLDRLALVIQQTPYQVHVVGHTDNNPIKTASFPSNWELSLIRASRVARHLIRAASLDPTRFVVMGRGQHDPAFPNEDEAKRALNRRVEIIITREIAHERNEEEE